MSLYNNYFLECAKSPTHKNNLDDITLRYKEENRHCGESIQIDILIENRSIVALSFNGDLSIVTTGSAEILFEHILQADLSIEDIFGLSLSDMLEMTEIEVTNRRKLALILPLLALRNALHVYLCDDIRDDFGNLLDL